MKNCIDNAVSCNYCLLGGLYATYNILCDDCHLALKKLIYTIQTNLRMCASPVCVEYAYSILYTYNIYLCKKIGRGCFSRLCLDVISAYIALGIPDLTKVNEVALLFHIISNDRTKKEQLSEETQVLDAEFTIKKMQILHLQKETEKYRGLLNCLKNCLKPKKK